MPVSKTGKMKAYPMKTVTKKTVKVAKKKK